MKKSLLQCFLKLAPRSLPIFSGGYSRKALADQRKQMLHWRRELNLARRKFRTSRALLFFSFAFLFVFLSETSAIGDNTSAHAPIAEPLLGGEFADLKASQVALIVNSSSLCTGILVGENVILTAGHCINEPARNYTIGVGGALYSVQQVRYNSKFDQHGETSDSNIRFDLGVLILSSPVSNILPLPILRDDPVGKGEIDVVYGFGENEYAEGAGQGKLGRVKIKVASHGLLFTYHRQTAVSVCRGDSGGPLVQFSPNAEFAAVIGVVTTTTNGEDSVGGCFLTNAGESGFVDLQSDSSRKFLKSVPGINYISGKSIKFYLEIQTLSNQVSDLLSNDNLNSVTAKAKQIAGKISALYPLSDAKRLRIAKRVKKELQAVTKARTLSDAQDLLQPEVSDTNTLLSYYVN